MYWSWTDKRNGISYVSWGKPRLMKDEDVDKLVPRYDVAIYSGNLIRPDESVVFMMQGDSTLGLGD